MRNSAIKVVAQNRQAYHEYTIERELECGVVLTGTEIKSVRCNSVSLKGSWIAIENGELRIKGMNIPEYVLANRFNVDTTRDRTLLAHKREIMELFGLVQRQGYTLIPLQVYLSSGRLKVKVGLCKGKNLHDKRESAKRKDMRREVEQAVKQATRE